MPDWYSYDAYEGLKRDVKEKSPSLYSLTKWFGYTHLSDELVSVVKPICALLHMFVHRIPINDQFVEGTKKLIEAKDCFVRAALDRKIN